MPRLRVFERLTVPDLCSQRERLKDLFFFDMELATVSLPLGRQLQPFVGTLQMFTLVSGRGSA